MDRQNTDRRSYLRGDFSFRVNMEKVPPEEYAAAQAAQAELFSVEAENLAPLEEPGGGDNEPQVDAALIDFLVQMDEKLDQILGLLTQKKEAGKERMQGLAVDISGSGMKLCVAAALEIGQIVRAKFFLAKFPVTFMDLYGEVVWSQEIPQNGPPAYHVGIEFLGLSSLERERIINFVFKRHREILRQRRSVVPSQP